MNQSPAIARTAGFTGHGGVVKREQSGMTLTGNATMVLFRPKSGISCAAQSVIMLSAQDNFMNRRRFLRSIAGMAGAKALAPLAPLAIAPLISPGEALFFLEPSQFKYRLPGITTMQFPKAGTYPVEVDSSDWSHSRGIVCYHIADNPKSGPIHTYVWKNPKNSS